jgi:hypothetical protein
LPTLGEKVDKTIGRSSEITNTKLTRERSKVEQDPTGSGKTHAFILDVLAEPFSTVSRKDWKLVVRPRDFEGHGEERSDEAISFT